MGKSNAKPCILYVCRNNAVLDEKITEILKKVSGKINTDTDLRVYSSPEEVEESEIINFLRTPSFFSERKVLVMKHVDGYPAALLNLLAADVENLGPDVFLVLTASKEKMAAKFLKAVKSVGTIKNIRAPSADSIRRWLKKRADADRIQFTGNALEIFLENTGGQLDQVKDAYQKIDLYAWGKKEKKIGAVEVNRLVPRVYHLRVFDLVDYLGKRDKNGALRALRSVLEEKWPLVGAVTLIHRCFKAMLYYKYGLDQQAAAYIKANTHAPPFLVDKILKKYKQFSEGYQIHEMVRIMGILNQYDLDLRDTNQPKNLMVSLISEITSA